MALSKTIVKQKVLSLVKKVSEDNDQDSFADALADIIVDTIKSQTITVTIPPGTIITTGSPTTQTNTTPVVTTSIQIN